MSSSDSDLSDVTPQPKGQRKMSDSSISDDNEQVIKRTPAASDASSEPSKSSPVAREIGTSDDSDAEEKTRSAQQNEQIALLGYLSSSGSSDDEDARKPDDSGDETVKRKAFHDSEDEEDKSDRDIDDDDQPKLKKKTGSVAVPIHVQQPFVKPQLGDNIARISNPGLFSISSRLYDSNDSDTDSGDEPGADKSKRRLARRDENTIRWRPVANKDGKTELESTAKIVKWTDGSMSLRIGTEIFEAIQRPINQKHICMRYGAGLAGLETCAQRYVFKPYSIKSKTHRKIVECMIERQRQRPQVKLLHDLRSDPEAERRQSAAEQEKLYRQNLREERGSMRSSRNSFRFSSRGHPFTGEDEDDDGINAIKNRYRHMPLVGDSDDGEEEEEEEETDEDLDEIDEKKKKKKVISSEDESDEEFRRNKAARPKKVIESDSD